MHRINTGPYEKKTPKAAVLLIHGLVDSSDTWIMNGRNNSVAFILADAGYDVWLGNTRGNKYSMNHTTLDPSNDFLYWDNTHNFISRYDLPAFIEYAKKESMVPNVGYIAHSVATQHMFYNLASNNASYFEDNINVLITLCSFYRHNFVAPINVFHMHAHKYIMEPFMHQFKLY